MVPGGVDIASRADDNPTRVVVASSERQTRFQSPASPEVSSVSGYAFFDSRSDGIRDSSLDVGVHNIYVGLFACTDDEITNSTVTDGSGYYKFEGLSGGSYFVRVPSLPLKIHKFSSSWNGETNQDGALSHPGADSAIIPEIGDTMCFDLEEGEDKTVMIGIESDVPLVDVLFASRAAAALPTTANHSDAASPNPTDSTPVDMLFGSPAADLPTTVNTSDEAPPNSTISDQVGISENKPNPTVSVDSTTVSTPFPHSSFGKEGCRCIDVSFIISSFTDKSCETSDGQPGVLLAAKGECVPHSYGSSTCRRHDAIHDPKCEVVASGQADMPNYCFRQWCYVDAPTCRQSSAERVFRSDHFARNEGGDLFYSYSTCGSTDEDWIQYRDEHSLDGKLISTIVPEYNLPVMYKRSATGESLSKGEMGAEYYDSSVLYEGAIPDYLDKLMGIANGMLNIDYTFGSEAGRRIYPHSNYTASVQDIADGLADMAIGKYWITAHRLKLTSFTIPLYTDKIVLAIPRPGNDRSLKTQTEKVLAPFELAVWGFILLIILVTALLSVWFTTHGREFMQAKRKRLKKAAYARVSVDEFLEKGMFFCSAGVEQDKKTSLPQKLLLFGFSFFSLIAVSTYVANLAAFLTQPTDFVGTIEAVNKRGSTVCAHPVLKLELQIAHPTVEFHFSEGGDEGMVRDYLAGKCDSLAAGKGDILGNVDRTKAYCDSGLVLTDSFFIEIPVAFPIRSDLSSGVSYWMHLGKNNHGITFEASFEKYLQPKCKLEFSPEDRDTSDYAQIHPANFFFPFMFFLGFAFLAVIVQFYHQHSLKKGNETSLAGRQSSFERNHRSLLCGIPGQFARSSRFDVNELDNSADNYSLTNQTISRISVLSNAVDLDDFHDNDGGTEQPGCKKRVKFLDVTDDASFGSF